jgi:hypothetical protein
MLEAFNYNFWDGLSTVILFGIVGIAIIAAYKAYHLFGGD